MSTMRRTLPALAAGGLLALTSVLAAAPVAAGVTAKRAAPVAALSGFRPESASFPTPATGFVLGGISCRVYHKCRAALAGTTDGGAHWRLLPAPDVLISDAGLIVPRHAPWVNAVLFASRRVGWLYGSGLWVTRDGGAHWRKLPVRGDIEGLAASSRFAYAQIAPPRAFASVLLRTPIGMNAWRRTGTFTGDPQGILAVSGQAAWFADASAVWVSTGAAPWREHPFACAGAHYGLTSLAAASASQVRFLCTNTADFNTAQEGIEIMASADGGKTEHLTGRKAPVTGDGGTIAVPPGNASVISFATSVGIPSWIGRSANAGRTWRTVLSVSSGPWGSLAYVSANVGWIVLGAPGLKEIWGLLRTTDAGRTWHAVSF